MPSPGTHATGPAAGAQATAHDDTRLRAPRHDHVVCRPRADHGQADHADRGEPHPRRMATLPQANRSRDTTRARPASDRRQLRHPQTSEGAGVAGETSSLHDAFHADLIVLAQSRGALLRRPDGRRNPRGQLRLGQRTHPRHQNLSGAAQRQSETLRLAGGGCGNSRQNRPRSNSTGQGRSRLSSCTAIESQDTSTLSATFIDALHALTAGQYQSDSFTYAIRMANGTLSYNTVTVKWNGVDNAAVIGNTTVAGVTEDMAVGGDGNL